MSSILLLEFILFLLSVCPRIHACSIIVRVSPPSGHPSFHPLLVRFCSARLSLHFPLGGFPSPLLCASCEVLLACPFFFGCVCVIWASVCVWFGLVCLCLQCVVSRCVCVCVSAWCWLCVCVLCFVVWSCVCLFWFNCFVVDPFSYCYNFEKNHVVCLVVKQAHYANSNFNIQISTFIQVSHLNGATE